MQLRSTSNEASAIERRKFYRHLLVHPSEQWLWKWMSLVYVCLITNIIIIPFRGIFDPFGPVTCSELDDRSSCSASDVAPTFFLVLDWSIDACFVLDMLLNFRLGYFERSGVQSWNNIAVMDGRKIACRYLRFWFWIDLLSILPWHQIKVFGDNSGGHAIVLLRNVRMIRLLRLFKLVRIRGFFQNWEHAGGAFSHPIVLRLLRYLLYTCIVAHIMACIAFLIPQLEGVPNDSWVVLEGIEIAPGRYVFQQYSASIYWTLMTLTTVGYGDVHMRRPWERMYASFLMLLGAVMFAYTVSNVAQLVRELDSNSTQIREKMDAIAQYMT